MASAKSSKPLRIVITGVTRGLGRAMVEGLIARGHTVQGCARDKSAVAELSQQYPAPHQFHALDITDDAAVAAWAKELLRDNSPIDYLLNNAAVVNRNAPLWKVPAEEFDQVVDVNIKGSVNVIRHFVPAMIKHKQGVIVNFSSGWGRSVSPEVAPYCATKWAIEGLTQALAEELPEGMAAIPLNPGIINTDMLKSCFGSAASSYPSVERWADRAVPYILGLGPQDNGRPSSIFGN